MSRSDKVKCALCQRAEETKITGALSTKDDVTAHQNCLLFSSGICCRDSPLFDDLFGFSAEDVLDEVKRGNKLPCHYCKKKGATAGCEVKRCKKSYHYPCAIQDGAKTDEDADNGRYVLYCSKHYNLLKNNNSCVNGFTKPGTSKSPTEAGPSKVYCLACETIEGTIRLDNLSTIITMAYCDKHTPSHKRKTNGDSSAAGSSVHNSDSNSSSSTARSSSKRPLSECEKQEESPCKRKSERWNGIVTDDSSDSDEKETSMEIDIFAPLENDLDESANSVPENQLTRKDSESAIVSASGNQQEYESKDENKDKDEDETIIPSDAESESLLLPLKICLESPVLPGFPSPTVSPVQPKGCSPVHSPVDTPDQHTNRPTVSQQSSPALPPSPDQVKPSTVTGSPPCTSSAITPAPPETACVSLLPSSSCSPTALPSNLKLGIDATSFWKSCNAARCTQAIFTDFINGMNEISSRIMSDQASQEDYDHALSVMAVSGKLAELVTKQQEELQRKQMELEKAVAAMKDVVAALKK